jgi:glucokinase
MILACDVGGTKTNLALLQVSGAGLEIVRLQTFPSREHASLDAILAAFTGGAALALEAAGFGVAGPVIGGRVTTTNLPWRVEGRHLADRLGLASVALLNDVEAYAWAVDLLPERDLLTLQPGAPARGNLGVVAAGTGFGASALVRSARDPASLASEAGHADFAAKDEREARLLAFLRARYGRACVEDVLSGPGLVNLYQFVRQSDGGEEPEWLAAALREGGGPAAITRGAIEGRSESCSRAVDLFLGLYGAEAGNWALRTLATGGMFIGGGIAARLFEASSGASEAWRQRAARLFLDAFLDKGRMRALLEAVPVRVILDDRAPLIGTAHCARTFASRGVPAAATPAEPR